MNNLNGPKILIVDDEKDFLEIVSARVRSWGYEPICVSIGKEAIEIVKEKQRLKDGFIFGAKKIENVFPETRKC
ncbi:MAG: hypothetical protein ABH836_02550 [Candidatus Omnitrophota bacterium]